MSESEAKTVAGEKCYACDATRSLNDCVGCGSKVCSRHLGAGAKNYRTKRDEQGYACHSCIERGLAAEKGTFANWHSLSVGVARIADTLANVQGDLLPAVMKGVDERLDKIKTDIGPAIATDAVEKISTSLDNTTKSLRESVDQLRAAITDAGRLIMRAALVLLLVNIVTVIAAVWIAKHI